jgi:hypothetical protein
MALLDIQALEPTRDSNDTRGNGADCAPDSCLLSCLGLLCCL